MAANEGATGVVAAGGAADDATGMSDGGVVDDAVANSSAAAIDTAAAVV